jgi:hypothetical protein
MADFCCRKQAVLPSGDLIIAIEKLLPE